MTASGHGIPSLKGTATHYETLGIDAAASPQEIRRAYRSLARQLHPDRHQQSSPERAGAAARRMSEINAAWNVLSNPAAKERYDVELRLATARAQPAASAAERPAGTAAGRTATAPSRPAPAARFATAAEEPARYTTAGGGQPIIRGILWVLVLGVLAAIFVFTAYAASGSNDEPSGTRPTTTTVDTTPPRVRKGDCVNELVGAMDLVDCGGPHDARVIDVVPLGRPCPWQSREVYLPDQQEISCLTGS